MTKKSLFSLFLMGLFCTALQAQNLKFGKPTDEEMKMTVYDKDPDAAAVVLCKLTDVGYTMDFHDYIVNYNVKVRIKVLKDEGKSYADLSIPYLDNPDEEYYQERLDEFKAVAYNLENGKVVKSKIGIDALRKERLDKDHKLAKAAIPQVKAGTVIEYEYKLISNMFYHIYDWYAQDEIPVAYTNYRLEIPAIFLFNVETSGLQKLQSSVTAGTLMYRATTSAPSPTKCFTNVYTCTGRDMEALKKDDYVWNVRDYFTRVTAELKTINLPGSTPEDVKKTWKQVDEILWDHPDFGFHLYKSSKFKDELAASGIANISDLKEKVAATYLFLRQRVAWNGEYDLMTHSSASINKKGNGTNADLNTLLINMLGDVGVKAYPVVMSTRRHGRLPDTYPSLNKLNTFIVGVPDGGSWLYLDASYTDGYLNVLPANLITERARIIEKGKEGRWVDLQKVCEAKTFITVTGKITPDGKLTGTQSALYSGNAAANERKAFREATDSAAYLSSKASSLGINITGCKMTGHRDYVPVVNEEISFSRQGNATDDHIYISPFIELPFTENPFLDKERLLPVEFGYKQSYTVQVKLALPDGWKLEEMPKTTRITTTDKSITGDIIYEIDSEGMIAIQYKFRLSKVTYLSNQYNTLKQLFELFASRSKDMLVLKKG